MSFKMCFLMANMENLHFFIAVLTLMVPAVFSADISHPDVLIMTADTIASDSAGSKIYYIDGDPTTWVGGTIPRILSTHGDPGSLRYGAVACDARKRMVYVVNAAVPDILSLHMSDTASIKRNYVDVSAQIGGLALDWMTDKLYWTDQVNKWIAFGSTSDLRTYTKIKTNVENLFGIAVHPHLSYLFWIEGGTNPTIKRSDLNGDSETTIVTSGLISPKGITIDFNEDKILWTDGDTIMSASFDGSERQAYFKRDNDAFSALTWYPDTVFVAETGYNTFVGVRNQKDPHDIYSGSMSVPQGVAMLSPQSQPLTYVTTTMTTTAETTAVQQPISSLPVVGAIHTEPSTTKSNQETATTTFIAGHTNTKHVDTPSVTPNVKPVAGTEPTGDLPKNTTIIIGATIGVVGFIILTIIFAVAAVYICRAKKSKHDEEKFIDEQYLNIIPSPPLGAKGYENLDENTRESELYDTIQDVPDPLPDVANVQSRPPLPPAPIGPDEDQEGYMDYIPESTSGNPT